MKKLIFLLFPLLFLNCDSDPDVDVSRVSGQWLLVASLADPGDGSGRFVAVEEKHTIGFGIDGNLNDQNNVFCGGDDLNYSLDKNKHQITITGCAGDPEIYGYELKNGVLILHNRRCIEACALKFRKFED